MKTSVLIAVLFLVFFSAVEIAQARDDRGNPREMERQLQQKQREMELRTMEMELEFENEMRGLELEKKKIELEHHRQRLQDRHHGGGGVLVLFLLICFVINLLSAIWVYLDIRKRNDGSGIWIVVTLLAGLFGILIYALIRLGDIKNGIGNPAKAVKK